IVLAPQMFGGPARRIDLDGPGQPRIPTVAGNHQNDQQLTGRAGRVLSFRLARLNGSVHPGRPVLPRGSPRRVSVRGYAGAHREAGAGGGGSHWALGMRRTTLCWTR